MLSTFLNMSIFTQSVWKKTIDSRIYSSSPKSWQILLEILQNIFCSCGNLEWFASLLLQWIIYFIDCLSLFIFPATSTGLRVQTLVLFLHQWSYFWDDDPILSQFQVLKKLKVINNWLVVQNCIQCMLEKEKHCFVTHFREHVLQHPAYYFLMRLMWLLLKGQWLISLFQDYVYGNPCLVYCLCFSELNKIILYDNSVKDILS